MHNRQTINRDFAKMLKGGVIMDVMNAEQARIAERAGAVAVMALERLPVLIRKQGGVARASDPKMIKEIQKEVSIPVMAKVRIGHEAEARILQALEVDFIDESEVLTPADPFNHIEKKNFEAPFVCGATSLGEALRRINEGAAMIRTKGEAGTGNVVEAVRHLKLIKQQIAELKGMNRSGMRAFANVERIPVELVEEVREAQRLPVVTFVAGGIATPADVALLMNLGAEGIFVGSGIFTASDPEKLARAIVEATTHFADAKKLAEVSEGLGELMPGTAMEEVQTHMQKRGL
jgi:pyridoxal 5'-phosphate synthase pdxS subunit